MFQLYKFCLCNWLIPWLTLMKLFLLSIKTSHPTLRVQIIIIHCQTIKRINSSFRTFPNSISIDILKSLRNFYFPLQEILPTTRSGTKHLGFMTDRGCFIGKIEPLSCAIKRYIKKLWKTPATGLSWELCSLYLERVDIDFEKCLSRQSSWRVRCLN